MSDEAKKTVLLVEDDHDVRSSIRRILEQDGYRVLSGVGHVPATRVAVAHAEEIDLVILDVVMPGMSGIALADRLARLLDDPRILYVSGFIAGDLPERHEIAGRTAFLEKPFTTTALLDRVRALTT